MSKESRTSRNTTLRLSPISPPLIGRARRARRGTGAAGSAVVSIMIGFEAGHQRSLEACRRTLHVAEAQAMGRVASNCARLPLSVTLSVSVVCTNTGIPDCSWEGTKRINTRQSQGLENPLGHLRSLLLGTEEAGNVEVPGFC